MARAAAGASKGPGDTRGTDAAHRRRVQGEKERFNVNKLTHNHHRDVRRSSSLDTGGHPESSARGLDLQLVLRTVALLMLLTSVCYFVAVTVFGVRF